MTREEMSIAIDQYRTEAEAKGYKIVNIVVPREEQERHRIYYQEQFRVSEYQAE